MSCRPVNLFPIPAAICVVGDLASTGVRMGSVDGRLQFLRFVSIAADEMDKMQVAYLEHKWGTVRHYAHNIKSALQYMHGPAVVAALNGIGATMRASQEDLVFRLLPHVDAAKRAFGVYEAWLMAYVWKLEANAKIDNRRGMLPLPRAMAPAAERD